MSIFPKQKYNRKYCFSRFSFCCSQIINSIIFGNIHIVSGLHRQAMIFRFSLSFSLCIFDSLTDTLYERTITKNRNYGTCLSMLTIRDWVLVEHSLNPQNPPSLVTQPKTSSQIDKSNTPSALPFDIRYWLY